MSAGHSHGGHGHHHDFTSMGNVRRLAVVFVLVALYTVAEALGGWFTGSLALLADAGHMLSDVAALGIALGAIWISRRPATRERTFGFYRAEVLGALINAVALVVIAIFIYVEAAKRFNDPPEVLGGWMLAVAVGGLLVNLSGLVILRDGHQHSLNVRGAWLHMAADTLGSVGAIVSALLIWLKGWNLADPIASVIIGTLVLWSSLALLRETVDVLMEATPSRLDLDRVDSTLQEVEGVRSVHDLHAWTISSGREALTAHVVSEDEVDSNELLPRLRELLRERFHLNHVTIQLEGSAIECSDCCFEEEPEADASAEPVGTA